MTTDHYKSRNLLANEGFGTIDLFGLRAARALQLVRAIQPARTDAVDWGILIRGRGFTRWLRQDPLPGFFLYRGQCPTRRAPWRFPNRELALRMAQTLGLVSSVGR